MFLLGDRVVYSASDLAVAADCEFALLRRLDAELGSIPSGKPEPDPMLERTARLGTAHERRQLAEFAARYDVVTMPRPEFGHRGFAEANLATMAAAQQGTDVIYQATFYDGSFLGYCDFLVRRPDGYAVYDTKLTRHARVAALLQLCAYADALQYNGIRSSGQVHLVLGDGHVSSHVLAELMPVYQTRRARLAAILDEKRSELIPVQWGDERYTACGRCAACQPEIEAARDLLLVAGMRITARAKLIEAGIGTLDELATHRGAVPELSDRTCTALRRQAEIQLRQERSGSPEFEIVDAEALGAVPAPNPGDIFFDFEGDPLYTEPGDPDWGLEYLFGVTTESDVFQPFWAHNRQEERHALQAFLDFVQQRRAQYPQLRIYHYAPYERAALLRLAGRHGVGEEAIDNLLRDNVLVDLYPIVRSALRVGQRSYSLKKLEPLYMGAELRDGDVTNAADSIVAYADYCAMRDNDKVGEAAELLAGIADYNAYDCRSTRRLRNWLRALADRHGVAPAAAPTVATAAAETATELEQQLRDYTGDGPVADRTPDQQAAALLAAAVGYHRRERKPFWWAHFHRLNHPVDEWADTRDVLVVTDGAVQRKWFKLPRQRKRRRILTLAGRFETGSALTAGAQVFTLYDAPLPDGMVADGPCRRGTANATVLSVDTDAEFRDLLVLEETLADNVVEYDVLPIAVTPGHPIRAVRLETAIADTAEQVCAALPELPATAALDILRRVPPRGHLPAPHGDYAAAITAALRSLDHSYVAVQGPPGTGKTYVGSQVVARLVTENRWRVGVVAQSHAVVENMLDAVVRAGVPGELVAKKEPRGTAPPWSTVAADDYAVFVATAADTGCVIGGTAWDFANANRIPRQSLDLLVVDEAGQFSLANTVAVAVAAKNLLLLGDPQQLPQVSQGTHPEPVDASALGWLAAGHDTLPPERGYFLERTWRMHPALCARVSALSYEGRLRSNESVTAARDLAGVAPGVETVYVDHHGNSTESEPEARAVVRQVRALLGTPWRAHAHGAHSSITQHDILVVAPYNAQVSLLRTLLNRARLDKVQVGTVDRFQGRQAAVVVVSMTASAVQDIPRGTGFLLSRNRLNVAISRAMWKAIVVRSRLLTEYLPSSPEAMAELGAFMRLCG